MKGQIIETIGTYVDGCGEPEKSHHISVNGVIITAPDEDSEWDFDPWATSEQTESTLILEIEVDDAVAEAAQKFAEAQKILIGKKAYIQNAIKAALQSKK